MAGNKEDLGLFLKYHVAEHRQVGSPGCFLMREILLQNANSCHFIKHAVSDTAVNPREGEAQPPAKEYSVCLPFFFYPKNQLVSLGTFLPAAVRGLGTCQFLRWPNTEGLISSKCSLPLALCVCVCVWHRERAGKPHREKWGSLRVTCGEREKRKKENAMRHRTQGKDGCSTFPSSIFCIACHNERVYITRHSS